MANPRGTGRLYLFWLVVFVGVAGLTLRYRTQSAYFYGIAETKEIVVSSEIPVEIVKIEVVEGQAVVEGQPLVELRSPEMNLKINQLTHQIEELKAAKGASASELRARIAQLRAAHAEKAAEISARIRQLKNQYDLNRRLTSGLTSLRLNTAKSGARNPIMLRLAALRRERVLAAHPFKIKINALKQQLGAPTSAAQIQVERLEQQLTLLRAENNKLKIFAKHPGVIGSVNFKPGVKVAPFVAILTVHTKTPAFIKGYVHENMHSSVALGDKVKVRSLAAGGVVNAASPSIVGEVVGVGSRIVAYPSRLCKHRDLQLWGREVLFRIPADNNLILGEKVRIETMAPTIGRQQRLVSALRGEARAEVAR